MIEVFVLRFVCDLKESKDKIFYVTEKIYIEGGLRFRSDDDTIIFFSKSAANIAREEMVKVVMRNHDLIPNPDFVVTKEYITPDQAQYTVNKPLHWIKKL